MITLITAWEVVKFGPVQKEYPTSDICNHIKRIEHKSFLKCFLGKDFYDDLISDLKDTSTCEAFNIDSTYALDDLILYEGCVLQSTIDNNTTHPDESDSDWKIADKFNTACYQELWECHLRYWLSLLIIHDTIRYTTHKAGAKGVVKVLTDDFVSVNEKELYSFKKEVRLDAEDELQLMYDYMLSIAKTDGTKFMNVQKIASVCGEETCLPPRKTRRRRIYIRN